MERVELHFHLLPGVDDGPADLASALDLARAAVADGTGLVVCTPHAHMSDVGYDRAWRGIDDDSGRIVGIAVDRHPGGGAVGSFAPQIVDVGRVFDCVVGR